MSAVVLLIHSTGTTPQMWSRLLQEVPLKAAVIAPVNLGYPPNAPLPRGQDFHWSQDVDLLRSQIPADATQVHLVGHSYGGQLAFKLALELQEQNRLGSLWLYEPVTFGSLRREYDAQDSATRQELDLLFGAAWFLEDKTLGGGPEWQEFFIDYWNRPGAWQAMPDAMKQATLAIGWKMYQEVRATCLDDTPFAHYRLKAPLTLLAGERTTRSANAMAHALAQINPQAQLQIVPGLGHMGPLVKPAALVESFRQHFAALLA